MAQKGQNQSFTRSVNLSLIMDEFKIHPSSRAEISRIFNLSKPAASKITAELEALRLISPCKNEIAYNQPGVKPVNYELNPDLGILAIIDLSTVEVQISVCDFSGKVLQSRSVNDMEVIEYKDFESFSQILSELLEHKELKGRPLLSICIAIPSAVNRVTQKIYWSPRFDIEPSFNPYQFFCQRFNTNIIIKNDVQLCLLAEKSKGGLPPELRYALLVYVDAGIGGSFYFDSRLEEGENGTAGDIGLYPVADDNVSTFLDAAASINAIKRKLKAAIDEGAATSLPKKPRFNDIKKAYLENDPLTVKTVNHTAHILANALVSFIEIFDLSFVILSGRITKLGENYLKTVSQAVDQKIKGIKIVGSSLDTAASDGAIVASINKIINDKIKYRKQNGDNLK